MTPFVVRLERAVAGFATNGKCIRTGLIPARSPFRLYGSPVLVKKFSGLQMKIWKKLFTVKVHPHGMDSARSPSSDCMSGLCLSRLSEINNGAARRWFFLRLHR